MKGIGIFFTFFTILMISLTIIFGVVSSYKYEKEIESYWSLAEKASTVTKKSEQIDKFVKALEDSKLQGEYNAITLETPDNSFDLNLEAVKTLQLRLHEIQTMDVSSFQYQTAMQQITAQEQGEAAEILSVFQGVWYKEHYFFLWNWVCTVQVIVCVVFLIIGLVMWGKAADWDLL